MVTCEPDHLVGDRLGELTGFRTYLYTYRAPNKVNEEEKNWGSESERTSDTTLLFVICQFGLGYLELLLANIDFVHI